MEVEKSTVDFPGLDLVHLSQSQVGGQETAEREESVHRRKGVHDGVKSPRLRDVFVECGLIGDVVSDEGESVSQQHPAHAEEPDAVDGAQRALRLAGVEELAGVAVG